MTLPGLIGERVFNLFDADRDGFLGKKEFMSGFYRLFSCTFEENLKLVYDLFDFDSDGKISKEDMRTLLSHVPLAQLLEVTAPDRVKTSQKAEGTSLFLDRLESQEELVKLLERCMKSKDTLSFEEFREMTEKESSTVFLCVLFSI